MLKIYNIIFKDNLKKIIINKIKIIIIFIFLLIIFIIFKKNIEKILT